MEKNKAKKPLSPMGEFYRGLSAAKSIEEIKTAYSTFATSATSEERRLACLLCALCAYRLSTGSTCILPQSLTAAALNFAKEFGDTPIEAELAATLKQAIKNDTIIGHSISGTIFLQIPKDSYEESVLIGALGAFLSAPKTLDFAPADIEKAIDFITKKAKVELSPEQRAAVSIAVSSPVSVISGEPGCGKTFAINVLIRAIKQLSPTARVLLAAPTGKAASRLSETTGEPAQTLHSLLNMRYEGDWKFCVENSISADMIIVDEASLLSLSLASRLFYMASPSTRLVFVGDSNQLPSIDPGSVLSDLEHSGIMPVTTLTTCYRQGSDAKAITDAASIVSLSDGPCWWPFPSTSTLDSPLHFIEATSDTKVQDTILNVVGQLIAKGISPQDIQVLSPTKKRTLGTVSLNTKLRGLLNPSGTNETFCIGDKIVCTENMPEKGVTNGDIGQVLSVKRRSIMARFGSGAVELPKSKVELAYALTVHKAQGSEYPVVVLALSMKMQPLLYKSMLYTALTRAKQKMIVVGSRAAVMEAVSMDKNKERLSMLSWQLKEHYGQSAA